jgi:hypothetical protein
VVTSRKPVSEWGGFGLCQIRRREHRA